MQKYLKLATLLGNFIFVGREIAQYIPMCWAISFYFCGAMQIQVRAASSWMLSLNKTRSQTFFDNYPKK